MASVYILGVGQIQFGSYPEETVRTLAEQSIQLALLDAGLTKAAIQAVYFANTFWGLFDGQHSIRGQVVVRGMGLDKTPVTNIENACAGGSTALHTAYAAVRAEVLDLALVVGAEKMTRPDKTESLASYDACTDVENYERHTRMIAEGNHLHSGNLALAESVVGRKQSLFVDLSATHARWHMERFGTTQAQLAQIASKNHFHGSLNPRAQYQEPMSVDEVQADRLVAHPFTRTMCAPLTDGAAAAVVCSERFLEKLGAPRPVKVLASVLGQGSDRELDGEDTAERLGKQAYAMGGVGPDDVDLAELHDATAYGELIATEALGLCSAGEGGPFAMSGATTLGGKVPVNTSGGLESQGHPSGASGLAQIHEVVTQLRGEAGQRQVEGARIGLTHNSGGNIGIEEAVTCVHILERMVGVAA